MAHPVTWFQIYGSDPKRLHTFYKKAFGWRMQPSPGPGEMQMVEREDGGIPGGIGAAMNGSASVTVFVSVGDIAAQMKKIEAAGGKPVMPATELPNDMGRIAGFSDPAGNWVGLWEPGKGRQARPKRAAKPKPKAKPAKRAAPKRGSAKKAPPKRATRAKKTRGRRA